MAAGSPAPPAAGVFGRLVRRPSAAGKRAYREALVYASVWINAAEAAYQLRREIANREKDHIEVVFGVYDLATNRVGLPSSEPSGTLAEVGLLSAPRVPEDLELLRQQLLATSVLQGLKDRRASQYLSSIQRRDRSGASSSYFFSLERLGRSTCAPYTAPRVVVPSAATCAIVTASGSDS